MCLSMDVGADRRGGEEVKGQCQRSRPEDTCQGQAQSSNGELVLSKLVRLIFKIVLNEG